MGKIGELRENLENALAFKPGQYSDANLLVVPGIYVINESASNIPIPFYGIITVLVTANNSWLFQEYLSADGLKYSRRRINQQPWSDWVSNNFADVVLEKDSISFDIANNLYSNTSYEGFIVPNVASRIGLENIPYHFKYMRYAKGTEGYPIQFATKVTESASILCRKAVAGIWQPWTAVNPDLVVSSFKYEQGYGDLNDGFRTTLVKYGKIALLNYYVKKDDGAFLANKGYTIGRVSSGFLPYTIQVFSKANDHILTLNDSGLVNMTALVPGGFYSGTLIYFIL